MRLLLSICLLISILVISGCSLEKASVSKAHAPSAEMVYQLDGQWQMYAYQLLQPAELAQLEQHQAVTVDWPLSFQPLLGETNGYATFYKQVKIDPAFVDEIMGIYSQYMYTAYKLYIDGQLVLEGGQVGSTKEQSKPEMQAKIGYFIPQKDTVELLLQISNFHHQQGGVNNDLIIGTMKDVTDYYHYQQYNMFFQLGSIMIMAIFAMLVSILTKGQPLFLAFGCFCLLMALRALFSGTIFATSWLPDASWLTITRIEYLITEWVSVTYLISLYLLYRDKVLKWTLYAATAITCVLTIVTLLTEVSTFQAWFKWLFIIVIPCFCYTLILPIIRLRQNSSLAIWLVIGSLLMLGAVVNDYLIAQNMLNSREMATYGALAFVVCQVIFVSNSYSKELLRTKQLNNELQNLNRTLDQKVQESVQDVLTMNEQLQQQVWVDGLMHIYNRKYFNEQFEAMFYSQKNIGLILIDIDDFKKFNDYYGHVAGDKLLKKFAQAANKQVPSNGFLARYGGEEFAVVLSDSSNEQCLEVATALCKAVESLQIQHEQATSGKKIVTVSVGAVFLKKRNSYSKPLDAIQAADQALYRAKHNGRNQVFML